MMRAVLIAVAGLVVVTGHSPAQTARSSATPRAEAGTSPTGEGDQRTPEQKAADAEAGAAFLGMGLLGFVCLMVAGLVLTLLPGFIAMLRGHQNTAAIFVLCFFLGWTVLGWIIAMVWAFTAVERPRYRRD